MNSDYRTNHIRYTMTEHKPQPNPPQPHQDQKEVYSLRVRDINANIWADVQHLTYKYDFPTEVVPRYHWTDPNAVRLMREEVS